MVGKALTVPLVVLVASAIGSAAVAPLAPTRLLVEYAASPATVDSEHPRFSWHNSVAEVTPSDTTDVNITAVGGGRRVVQWAFRVQVCEVPLQRSAPWSGTTWECDSECASGSCVWDSGKVSNATKSWNICLASTTPLLSDRVCLACDVVGTSWWGARRRCCCVTIQRGRNFQHWAYWHGYGSPRRRDVDQCVPRAVQCFSSRHNTGDLGSDSVTG